MRPVPSSLGLGHCLQDFMARWLRNVRQLRTALAGSCKHSNGTFTHVHNAFRSTFWPQPKFIQMFRDASAFPSPHCKTMAARTSFFACLPLQSAAKKGVYFHAPVSVDFFYYAPCGNNFTGISFGRSRQYIDAHTYTHMYAHSDALRT